MTTTLHVTRLTVVHGNRAVYTLSVNEYTSDLDTLRKTAVEAYLNEISKELNVDLTYNEVTTEDYETNTR